MRHPHLTRIERAWLGSWGMAALVAWAVTHL